MILVLWRDLDGWIRLSRVTVEGLRRMRRDEKGGWIRILRVVRVEEGFVGQPA